MGKKSLQKIKYQQEDMQMEYTMQIVNQRTGGMMMDKRGISSKMAENLQGMEKIMQGYIIS